MRKIIVDVKTTTENSAGIFFLWNSSYGTPQPPPLEECCQTRFPFNGHAPKMISGAFCFII